MYLACLILTICDRYDRGAYLFLPSYIMRTHGAKQQRIALKRVPKSQLEPVFKVWKLNSAMFTVGKAPQKVLYFEDYIK